MDNVDRFNPSIRSYHKTNFVDILEKVIPSFYITDDYELSGTQTNPLSEIINCNIKLASKISNVLSISSVPGTQTKNLGNISGISQYFVKQNDLTKITPYTFETKILAPLGTSLLNFSTSAAFNSYLSANLLPKIRLATSTQSHALEANKTTLSALTLNANASSVHNYLVDNLGWFYFLNTSARGGLTYSPSSYVLESLNTLYTGNTLETVDGIKGVTEYLWRNNSVCSFGEFLPAAYISGTSDAILNVSAGIPATYTSGIQKLEALKTLIDVIYSPLYIDKQDFAVKNAFDDYMNTSYYLTDSVSKGPLRKLLNVLGFNFTDISNEIENIGLIYDINNVREEHLQHIADLIGFRLRGNSTTKWRHQLAVAVDLYKSKGTLASIQAALNALIVDSVFDISGNVQELWESYLPHIIWYSLATESPLFKNLTTWTSEIAKKCGVYEYSMNSLEENLRMATDSIILDMYKAFPENFLFNGKPFDPLRLYRVDKNGNELGLYTVVGEPNMKPFHYHEYGGREYRGYKTLAELNSESRAFEVATGYGALGSGVYMAGLEHPDPDEPIVYLKPAGDINFLFNYRGKYNYPLPPFEEVKYYRDSTVTSDMIKFMTERLKCFKVNQSFADNVNTFILSSAVTDSTDLGALNEWLMFFSSVQTPPNFNDVISNISDYEKDILSLWNGKSSHLFINFEDTDFDFSKTTMEGDGANALYEAARVSREFAPAHTITRVNLTGRATDDYTDYESSSAYIAFDQEELPTSYTSASVLAGFQYSGVALSFATGGGDSNLGSDGGRGGLNTFKRSSVDSITDSLVSSTSTITPLQNVRRRSVRRRNLKYLLPREGYYDRTGFNAPDSLHASTLEYSMPSSLGELTLGYVPSAGRFHPVVDPVNPSGVWHSCESLNSSRQFSGVFTSATYPYRGLSGLDNAKARYSDRGQVPQIYITMHALLNEKARSYAAKLIENDTSSYASDDYWKNNIESLANQLIANGFTLNSFDEYENFSFGTGMHKVHRDYCKYFAKHDLSDNTLEKTGGNIFAQVFGSGLFNCDFSLAGSAGSSYINATTPSVSSVNSATIWNTSNTGTTIASSTGRTVIPLIGSFSVGQPFNAEFRNPHILSGIELCDISGAPASNQFIIFKLDPSTAVSRMENYLVSNTVVKCKSVGGLPRLRFDLSSYGDRRNYLIPDHQFNLRINALVGDERERLLGGGKLGVWIHTQPVSGVLWSWVNNTWTPSNETDISLNLVLNNLSNQYLFELKNQGVVEEEGLPCYADFENQTSNNDKSLNSIKQSYLETFSITFDTRNFTTENNYEYLEVLPISDENYQKVNQVHKDSTNYIIEVFFVPNRDINKYLLIDSIELQDLTLRENAGLGTGYGVETEGVPLKKFVKEDKVYLNKEQLRDTLKFFNGLAGLETGLYSTNIASRNATLASGTLELSGGSRLSYREHPEWNIHTKNAIYNNYTRVEFEN